MLAIITGTINPENGIPDLVLTNSNERLKQYIEAIKKVLKSHNIKKVIFCDNSNSKIDISNINYMAKQYNKEIEFFTFSGDKKKVLENGKGFGEGEIIDYILKNSKLIKQEDYFIKITGRLYVENIDKIIYHMDKKYNYFNKSSVGKKCNMVDTRFYGVKISDYNRYLRKAYESVDDRNGKFLEHIFYNVLKQYKVNSRNMPFYPRISGQSGSMGILYKTGIIKGFIKDFTYKINMFSVK